MKAMIGRFILSCLDAAGRAAAAKREPSDFSDTRVVQPVSLAEMRALLNEGKTRSRPHWQGGPGRRPRTW